MKKTILYFLTLLAAGMLAGCLDNFDEYNRNPNETTDDQLNNDNYLVGSKITGMQNNVVPTEEHLYQFSEILVGDAHAHYDGSTPEWTNRFETGNPPTNWVKAVFVDPITNLYTYYRGIVSRSDNEVILALADVLRVASMHRLTDQFGPIPYTKIAENGGEELTTAYDDQQAVYTAMFGELDAALAVFEANTGLSSEALADYDMVYYGDISKWMKFTNSLKLRMAMRLSYIAPDVARSKAAEAIAAGVITANADNAEFHPVLNRLAMIWNEWQDHVIGADILCYMNGYEDPRREKMFTTVDVTETIPDPDTGQPVEITRQVYQGIRIGVMPASAQAAKTQCSFPLITEQSPVKWMNAAEVAFLMSEYQLRWGTMSEAGALYKKGVALSFEEWGAGKADAYLADATLKPAAYVDPLNGGHGFAAQSTITPVWNDEDTPETALERIITQKYIALFPLGNEAWAEYRRTGYPRLMPIPDDCDKSGGTITPKYGARRVPYPAEEYAENRANVEAAVQMLGGADNAGTRLWWDCKPLN